MHIADRCHRSILDDMRDALFYKGEINLKRLVAEIIDSAESRSAAHYGYGIESHIRSRIDELAERHGNLTITRKKLFNLVRKEQRRRWRRHSRKHLTKRYRRYR